MHRRDRIKKRSTRLCAGASAFLGAIAGLGGLWLSGGQAQAAYNLTVAYSGTTANVTKTTVGSVTTFAATGTGATVTIPDIATELLANRDVVVDSGSTGAEAGDITYSGVSNFSMASGNNRTLTFQSGTGSGLVGDITLAAFNVEATGMSVVVHAQRNIVLDALSTDFGNSGSISLIATTGSIQKTGSSWSQTAGLSLEAATGIGSTATPFLTIVNNVEAQTATGDIVLTNSDKDLTVGGVSGSLSGLQITGAGGDIRLVNSNNKNINLSENLECSGTVSLQSTGTLSQTSGSKIEAANLALQAVGGITLTEANDVDNLALNVTSASAVSSFTDSDDLTISSVDGIDGAAVHLPGLSSNGLSLVSGGTMTLAKSVSAVGGIVHLYSGNGFNSTSSDGKTQGYAVTFHDTSNTGRTWSLDDDGLTVDGNVIPAPVFILSAHGGGGDDTFNVTPSTNLNRSVDGGNGTDTLNPDYTGTTNPAINPTGPGEGYVSFDSRQNLYYFNIENVTAPPNAAPVNSVPAVQTTTEDTALTFSAANSNALQTADADAGTSQVRVTLTVDNGTLTLADTTGLTFQIGDGTADGSMTFSGTLNALNAALNAGVTYQPGANFNGSDTLTVITNDLGNTGSGGAKQDTDTVAINVSAVNDAPVANSQSVNIDEDTAKAITLIATDVDNNPLTYAAVAQPSHGTLSGTAPNLTYTPNANYNGPDAFTFKANDGTVDSNTAIVTITVAGSNDTPVADADSYTVDGAGLTVAAPGLLVNDTDADGDNLTVAIATQAAHGTVALNADGSFTYTVTGNYSGIDSFTYTVSDGQATATGTVTLNVSFAPITPELTLTIAPDAFNENAGPAAAVGTISRNGDISAALAVTLNSSDTTEATVPTSVVIPAGETSTSFAISAVDENVRDGDHDVIIRANANGFNQVASIVRVQDNGINHVPLSLKIDEPVFLESAGLKATAGEVSIPTPAKIDYVIDLTSSDETEARVAKTVTIKAGFTKATFWISAVDDSEADGAQPVILTAKRLGFGSASRTLKVGDDEQRGLMLTLEKDSIIEGSSAIAVVGRTWAIDSAMTVLLNYQGISGSFQGPSSISIPAGAISTTFTITSIASPRPDNTQDLRITATRPGLTSDSATLHIVDSTASGGSLGNAETAISKVALSTASVSAATGAVRLVFDGPLEEASLTVERFTVTVDGKPLAVESLSYDAATNTVTLLLPTGSLQTGDTVEVAWKNLLDTKKATLQGRSAKAIQ